jgi:hypothetical protein
VIQQHILYHCLAAALEHGVAGKAADVYSFGVLLWQVRPVADLCYFESL